MDNEGATTDSSFQSICIVLAASVSVIFSLRYVMQIAAGVDGVAFAPDFDIFYRASQLFVYDMWTAPYNLYGKWEEPHGPIYHPFLNPPFLLLLLWPMGFMSHGVALATFESAQIAVWLLVLACSPVRALWPSLSVQRFYLLKAFAVSLPFICSCLLVGQLGILYGAILLLGVGLLSLNPAWGGGVLALISLKPTLGILIPIYLLAARQWRAAMTCAVTTSILVLLSSLLWGPGVWLSWLLATNGHVRMLSLLEIPEQFRLQLVSVYSGWRLLGASPSVSWVAQLATAFGLVILLCKMTLHAPRDKRIVPLLFVATFLATGYTLQYDTVLLSAVILYLIAQHSGRELRPLSRISILIGLCMSILTPPLQASGLPLGPITVLWLGVTVMMEHSPIGETDPARQPPTPT